MMTDFEAAAARACAEGRREQRCPKCGREEGGGAYCTAGPLSTPPCDFRPMDPDQWVASLRPEAVRAARRRGAARRWEHQEAGEPPERSNRPPDALPGATDTRSVSAPTLWPTP